MADFELDVGLDVGASQANFDTALASLISKYIKTPIKIPVSIDKSKVDKQIKEIQNQIASANSTLNITTKSITKSNSADSAQNINQKTSAYDKYLSVLREIKTTQAGLGSVSKEGEAFKILSERLDGLIKKKQEFDSQMKNGDISFTDDEIAQIEKLKSEIDLVIAKQNDAAKAAQRANSVMTSGTKEYSDALSKINQKISQTESNISSWTAAKNGKSSGAYENLQKSVTQLSKLRDDLFNEKISKSNFDTEFKRISANIAGYNAEIKNAGENTRTFTSRIAGLSEKFTQWLSVSQIIMYGVRNLKQMVANVKELDTAMTELKKVTNETDTAYANFLDGAAVRAKRLGATVSDTITATADYARLGYSMNEASDLADTSIIYKNVGDGISNISDASESIISTMKAFNIEASDSMTIVDKFNQVGNNFAISSKGVGDALLNSASSLATANNTLDESIGLITAGNNVVQNPEKVGTALKTISMYLRAAKTEAEDAGESTEGMAKSVSELRSDILKLTGNRVDIQIDENNFKSTYQIMKDLSEVWGDLTDLTQANIIEKIGGKRNANVVTAILGNFDTAESVVKSSLNSAGSAMAENEKYLDSIEGKTAQFKATFEDLSRSLLDSDLIKFVVDAGSSILDTITNINKAFGSLAPAAATITGLVTAFKALKGVSFGFFSTSGVGADSKLAFNGKTFDKIKSDFSLSKESNGSFSFIKNITAGLSNNYTQAEAVIKAYNMQLGGTLETQQAFQKVLATAPAGVQSYINSLDGAAGSLEGCERYCLATGDSMKNMGRSASMSAAKVAVLNAVLNMLISAAIVAGIKAIGDAFRRSREEAENLHNEVTELVNKYNESNAKAIESKKTINEIGERYAALSQYVNPLTNENISLNTEEYKEYLSIVDKISNTFPEMVQGYDDEGNAILSCKGNVDELTNAYKEQLKAANDLIVQNRGKIGMDYQNQFGSEKSFESSFAELYYAGGLSKVPILSSAARIFYGLGETLGIVDDKETHIKSLSTDSLNLLKKIRGSADDLNDVAAILNNYKSERGSWEYGSVFSDIEAFLTTYGIDKSDISEGFSSYMQRVLSDYRDEFESVFSEIDSEMSQRILATRTYASGYFSQQLNSLYDELGNVPDGMQSIIQNSLSGLNDDFYQKFIDDEGSINFDAVNAEIDDIVNSLSNLNEFDQAKLTAFFDIQTRYNNGKVSPTEYIEAANDISDIIEELSGDEDIIKQIKLQLGIDEKSLTDAKISSNKDIMRRYEQAQNIGNQNYINQLEEEVKRAAESQGLAIEQFKAEYGYKQLGNIISDNNIDSDIFTKIIASTANKEYKQLSDALGEAFDNKQYDLANVISDRLEEMNDKADTMYQNTNDYIKKSAILQDALSKIGGDIGTGSLSPRDIEELNKLFPELDTNAENLSSQILSLLGNMDSQVVENFADMFGNIDSESDRQDLLALENAILSFSEASRSLDFRINITEEAEKIEALNTAINESASATGLSAQSIDTLKSKYRDLPGFEISKFFEQTANGVHINAVELQKLEAEYERQNYTQQQNALQGLIQKYELLSERIDSASESERSGLYTQRDAIAQQIKDVSQLLAQYDGLTSAYKKWQDAQSTTDEKSMYEDIIAGKDQTQKLLGRGWITDDVKTYIDLLSSADLSTANASEVLKAYKDLNKEIGKSGHNIWDFFTVDEDGNSTSKGVYNFFDTVRTEVGKNMSWLDKNGNYHFDFGVDGAEKVAKALNMDVEAVEALLRAASDAGFEVAFDSIYTDIESIQTVAEKAVDKLSELTNGKYSNFKFNFESTDIQDIYEQVYNAEKMLDEYRDSNGIVNLDKDKGAAQQIQMILAALLSQKNELEKPLVMSISTKNISNSKVADSVSKVQDFIRKKNLNDINLRIGADTSESRKALEEAITNLKNDPKIKTAFEGTEIDLSDLSIDNIDEKLTAFFNNEDWLIGKLDVDQSALNETAAAITDTINNLPEINLQFKNVSSPIKRLLGLDENGNLTIGISANTDDSDGKLDTTQEKVDNINKGANAKIEATDNATSKLNPITDKLSTINNGAVANVTTGQSTITTDSRIGSILSKLWTITQRVWTVTMSALGSFMGGGGANGTAYATGTAMKSGNWGTKRNGVALGGELGQELIVRDGRFFTIGDDSAEFFRYKKGDIIFNHEQTREILTRGKIVGSKRRGYALAEGTAFESGSGLNYEDIVRAANATSSKSSSTKKSTSKSSSKSKSSSSKKDSKDSEEEESLEKINFIEIILDRIERSISRLERTATSSYKSLKNKLSATADEISQVTEEISIQQKAFDKYMEEASKVELSEDIKSKIRNGSLDITEYESETAELINDYKDLYENALDCEDAIEELHETIASLYENQFNDTLTDYENQLSLIEHRTHQLESGIDMLEARGHFSSETYYRTLQATEVQNIGLMTKEVVDLKAALQTALDSGEIEEYSEAWYDMKNSINEVEEAIDDARVSLVEYQKSIRDLRWEQYDFMQDQISQLTKESDFLIDLMSSDELFDDMGNPTKEGTATLGLHAMNYDVYMSQADRYAAEAKRINAELLLDWNNTELIERRNELLQLQRDSILAAEQEKTAISDLVSEGIDVEISSIKDLIDAYVEALDTAKDLYDYQRRVSDNAKKITSLEKQLSAYQNDNSEETKAKIQRLKVDLEDARKDLEETEFDHYISEQKKLLDNLSLEYEDVLNQRMDNVDLLLSDAISTANENTKEINQTLRTVSNDVGYTLTEGMRAVWTPSILSLQGTLSEYGDGFNLKLTSLNAVVNSISAKITAMAVMSEVESVGSMIGNGLFSLLTDKAAGEKVASSTPASKPATTQSSTPAPAQKSISIGSTINAGNAKIYTSSNGSSPSTQYFKNDPIYTVVDEKNGYILVRHHSVKGSATTGWFKKSDVKAYRSGGLVDYTGLAWLDGTPQKPETVLDSEDSANFVRFVELLDKFNGSSSSRNIAQLSATPPMLSEINDSYKKMSALIGDRIGNAKSGDTYINIGIDHVEDYNDFMNQLTQDNQFVKFIESFTTDRLAGRSSLAKNKYKW